MASANTKSSIFATSKRASLARRLEIVLLGGWFGALLGIGFIAAPALFQGLPDRLLAGTIAAQWFAQLSVAGNIIGILLVVLLSPSLTKRAFKLWRVVLAGFAWLLSLLASLWVLPAMAAMRALGPAMLQDAAVRASFGRWHAGASIGFIVTLVAVFVLLWTARAAGDTGDAHAPQ